MRRASGPPVMMHSLPQQLDKVRYVATINVFFLLTNALKLIPTPPLASSAWTTCCSAWPWPRRAAGGMERVVAAVAGQPPVALGLGMLLAGS